MWFFHFGGSFPPCCFCCGNFLCFCVPPCLLFVFFCFCCFRFPFLQVFAFFFSCSPPFFPRFHQTFLFPVSCLFVKQSQTPKTQVDTIAWKRIGESHCVSMCKKPISFWRAPDWQATSADESKHRLIRDRSLGNSTAR